MSAAILSPEDGLLGLSSEEAPSTVAPKAVVIPFGIERTVSWRGGTGAGPQAIIDASHQVELFDEEHWCEPYRKFRLDTLAEPEMPERVEDALDLLAGLTGTALDDGAFPVVLGGEHSLTPGAIRPFLQRYPDLALLHFDAHADLRDGYEGEHYSHAAAIRRCMDAPELVVVSLGIRNISAGEIPFLEENRHRLHIHWAKDRGVWDLDAIVRPLEGRHVYVTFDLDGFDSSLMSATGTPEPGGLFWADVMPVLKRASKVSTFVGADIVELAPAPELFACDFLAAKLAYKILGYKFCGAGRGPARA
ncbi:MAG: agmatinase family protein [Rhodospirillaceae bacterium]